MLGRLAGALTIVLMAGCAGTPKIADRSTPPATARGEVGVQLEAPQAEGEHRLDRGQSAARADRFDQPLPVYPPAWLGQELGVQGVLAWVSIDAEGQLTGLDFPTAAQAIDCGACAADFIAATRVALQGWQFAPLEVSDWVDGPDEDGDGEADSVQRAVVERRPYSLRLRFHFSQSGGRGLVEAGPASDQPVR